MTSGTTTHPGLTPLSPWRAVWRGLTGRWQQRGRAAGGARRQMIAELVRIAETSPHLLADAGLTPDVAPAGAGGQIWRCPAQGIVISIAADGRVTPADLAVG